MRAGTILPGRHIPLREAPRGAGPETDGARGSRGTEPEPARTRSCPNLLQRRPAAGSAARRSAEYQRFSSGAPARSGPLQQIRTTCAATALEEGIREPDGDHDGCTDGRAGPAGIATTLRDAPSPGRRGPPVDAPRRARTYLGRARSSLNPRERLLEVRARGLSDVLAGYPAISRTAAPTSPAPLTSRCALRIRKCSSNRRSRVRSARLDEEEACPAPRPRPTPARPSTTPGPRRSGRRRR